MTSHAMARALEFAQPDFSKDTAPELPPEAFEGLAGDFVRLVEPHSESHPAALLLQFLAAFGNAIGPTAHFRIERTSHRGNLFVCVVGDTAKARKGTSLGWVEHVMREAVPDWAPRIVSGLSSGEGIIHALRDASDEQPAVVDKRLFAKESEFASVLQKIAREGNSLSALLREAWDSTELQVLTRKDPLRATGAHVSVVTHITREELGSLMSATEQANGLANRFLWALVHRTKQLPDGGSLETDSPALLSLISRVREAVARAATAGRIGRSAEAAHIWRTIYGPLSEGTMGTLGKVTSRAEAQVIRLPLLFALLDGAGLIETRHLLAGVAVWHYCFQSARHIFGSGTGDRLADQFLEHIKRAGVEGVARSELHRSASNHASKRQLEAALDLLVHLGLAVRTTRKTRGAPEERWFATAHAPAIELDRGAA